MINTLTFSEFISHICEFKENVVKSYTEGHSVIEYRNFVYSYKLADKYKNAVWEYIWSDITYDQLLILLIENKKI